MTEQSGRPPDPAAIAVVMYRLLALSQLLLLGFAGNLLYSMESGRIVDASAAS